MLKNWLVVSIYAGVYIISSLWLLLAFRELKKKVPSYLYISFIVGGLFLVYLISRATVTT